MYAHGAYSTAIGDARVIRASTRGQGDEVRGQVAPALDLERIPRAKQVRLLLLVLEEVNDEVDNRRRCVQVAVERVPDGRDEIARAGLGRRVVAQGELDARNGAGGVCCESAQAREYRRIASWEKEVGINSAWMWIERDVLGNNWVQRWWWRWCLLPAGLGRSVIRISLCGQVCAKGAGTAVQA